MDTNEPASSAGTPLVLLSVLALLAGASGMAVSFLFLSSKNNLDVIAGASGFLAGAILLAAGVLALSIQSQSTSTSQAAIRAVHCLIGVIPPAAAILAWPVLYFGAFIAGMVFMPIVLLGCGIWAWILSRGVAENMAAVLKSTRVSVLRGMVFSVQLAVIVASWPLFLWLLNLLASMGYKVGWS